MSLFGDMNDVAEEVRLKRLADKAAEETKEETKKEIAEEQKRHQEAKDNGMI